MKEHREPKAPDQQHADDPLDRTDRTQSISPDSVLAALANEYRRAVLDVLISASERTLDYETLVDRVAIRIRADDAERVSDEDRQRIRIGLYHNHLPLLTDVQAIEYDPETGRVEFVGGELIRDVLTLARSNNSME